VNTLSADDEKSSQLRSMLSHDAKAQLVNITGFCQEIANIAGEFKDTCQTDTQQTNADVTKKLHALLEDDLLPCVEFLTLSAQKLDQIHKDVLELSLQKAD